MVNLLALSPVLVLLGGALVMALLSHYPRLRPFVVLVAILGAAALLWLNYRQDNLTPVLFVASTPLPDLDLRFNLNPAGLACSWLVLLGVAAWMLVENLNPRTQIGSGLLVALAGAVAFLNADDWTAIAAASLLVDLGLLTWRLGQATIPEARAIAWRGFAMGAFGAFLILCASFMLLNNGSSLRLDDPTLDGWAATLVLVAAWIRSGIFPFHLPLARRSQSEAALPLEGTRANPAVLVSPSPAPAALRRIRQHGLHASSILPGSTPGQAVDDVHGWVLSTFLGLYLFVRALLVLEGPPEHGDWLLLLALFGLAATALLALLEPAREQKLAWVAQAVAFPVVLMPFLPFSPAFPAFAIWLSLGAWNVFVLLIAARLLRPHNARQPWRQVVWGAVILCAAGFPLTPGFMGRIGLYAALLRTGPVLYLAVLPAVLTLALIPLWRAFFDVRPEEERHPYPVEYLGLALLLLSPLLAGVMPFFVTRLFGRPLEDVSAFAFDALFHPSSILEPLFLLLLVLLPLPLSYVLARRSPVWAPPIERTPRWVIATIDLSVVARVGVLIMDTLVAGAREAAALLEQHPVGWVLFAAIWVALWFLNARW